MKKEKTFLNLITYAPLVFIPLFVVIIISLSYQAYSHSFNLSIKNLEKDTLHAEKEALKTKIDNLSKLIVYKKSEIKNKLTNRVKNRVQVAYDMAHNIYTKYKDTKSEKEIKDIIKTTLATFTWNNGESFIWIVDYDGVFQLAPKYLSHLQNTSIINLIDATGRYVIQEEISICKEKGEGFLWDTFTKPNTNDNKQYEQVAFVKAFEDYNWYFGSSEYLDTATKKMDTELFSMINNLDNMDNNYVFVIDMKGNILAHKFLPQFVGKDMNITDPLVLNTVNTFMQAIKDKNQVTYEYDWYDVKTKKKERKFAYLRVIPDTNWFIGSGFLLTELENKFMKQKVDMLEIYHNNSKYILYITIFVILFSLIFSYFVSRQIKRSFRAYQTSIGDKTQELEELNETLENKVKNRTEELEKARDSLETLATTDALTQIHNRYSIMNIINHEISRSHRYNAPLSVLMFDIDFFKNVNDTYGHDVGDNILSSLSSFISKQLRDIDYMGRYGGEEFIIVMPNTTLEDSTVYAQRLREEVAELHFEKVENITISIGLIELKKDENIDEMFKRLDNLLYYSKNNGRNKVSYK